MTPPIVADNNTSQRIMGASVGVQLHYIVTDYMSDFADRTLKSTSVTESRKERGFCGSLATDMQCTYDTNAHCIIDLPA